MIHSDTTLIDCKDGRMYESIKWLLQEIDKLSFGEVTLGFTIHQGQIRSIEKNSKIKEHKEKKYE